MNWLSIAKFAAPVVIVLAIYFYGHDAGWHKREALVPAEIQTAADAVVKTEREACAADQALTKGVSDGYQKNLTAANRRYADAVGLLYDASHKNGCAIPSGAGVGLDAGAHDNRLYYADQRAAYAALERARIATTQAEQLTACQKFINGERGR